MIDDDEEVEVGLVALGGMRLIDPSPARIASIEDDLEDARLLLPGGGRNRGRVAELLEQDLHDALQLALLGGREMIKAGFHRQTILAARWRLAQPRPPRAARLRSEPALPPRPTIDLARAVQSAGHTCDAAFAVLYGQRSDERRGGNKR